MYHPPAVFRTGTYYSVQVVYVSPFGVTSVHLFRADAKPGT